MQARSPSDVHEKFREKFLAGDLEELVTLYEPNAGLVPEPGKILAGRSVIREHLKGLLAIKGRFWMEPSRVVQARDVALLFARWTLTGASPAGSKVELAGETTDVVRRQLNGTWLIALDNRFGLAGAEAAALATVF